MKRLAIVATHPIQYYAPVFKLLHQRKNLQITVYYTWGEKVINKYDPGFEKFVSWDIPLLEGYPFEWAKNTAADPGSHHFNGIVNPEILDQIDLFKPNAILLFGWAYHGHLKILRHFKRKIPIYFRGDSTLLDEKKGIKTIAKGLLLKWIYSHVHHAFYVGTNNKEYFKKYGLSDNQLSLVPHAIDNDRFSEDKSNEAQLVRKKLGISAEDILILFAGKLEEKKSPIFLVKAFLEFQHSKLHLAFLGSGSLEINLKKVAGNAKNIHFIGFQNQTNIPKFYQACDLFCLPSAGPGETWGLAVNEAMICGKAILVSNKVGCAIDLVKDNFNGFMFQCNNIPNFVGCLKKLTESKSRLKLFGENSKKIIKGYNFTNVVNLLEEKILNETH